MSFEDIEAGRGEGEGGGRGKQDRSDGVAAGIFSINTSVSVYRQLVNALGTQRDNDLLRGRMHAVEQKIGQMVEETLARLKEENEADHLVLSSGTSKKVRDAKLAKDFQSVLQEFQTAKKAAQSRQLKYGSVLPPASSLPETAEEAGSLRQSQQLVVEANESEVLLNSTLIEERDEGIQEIQQQIGEVSEIFKDLAQIVANQGYVIDDIEANIESSASAAVQANVHLTRAAKSQTSSEYWKCVILAIIGTILFAFFIIMFA